MDERFGPQAGALVRRWLADIRAAERLGDVPFFLNPTICNRPNEMTIELGSGLKMLVKANQQQLPKLKNDDVDWRNVDRILIQRIDCAHA